MNLNTMNKTISPQENHPAVSGKIVFDSVCKTFEHAAAPAVNQVSFNVTAGDLVVLLGPSGCGKTTLMKMINRLYEPDEGRILIEGRDIQDLPLNDLRRRIGYVIQQVGLFPHMDIRKNITVVPHLLGWPEEKINRRVDDLLQLIGLPAAYLSRYPRQLSGGEQQRVGLARALAADPDILLMDEPFAAVDAINRERLQNELIEINCKLNKTILFVTHDVEEAFRLADKIIVMNGGRLIQYGTPFELVSKPRNAFIEELVGSHNMLRRLSLVNVQSILKARRSQSSGTAPVKGPAPVLSPEDDLRSALSLLLSSGADCLQVVEPGGKTLGEVGFADLRAMLFNQTLPEKVS
ncbi:MAG: ABC transporter ATP-binding protein [Anaerolineae bacterium]|nr:ABC transporter ATP-binding protein [Anaerolineae bacterium]